MKMLINKNWKKRIKDVLVGLEDESGMGVVEIVLFIVSLVVIFKKQITSLVSTLVSKMSSQAKQV